MLRPRREPHHFVPDFCTLSDRVEPVHGQPQLVLEQRLVREGLAHVDQHQRVGPLYEVHSIEYPRRQFMVRNACLTSVTRVTRMTTVARMTGMIRMTRR